MNPTAISTVTSRQAAAEHDVVSPVTGDVIDRVPLAGRDEILGALEDLTATPFRVSPDDIFAFLVRLETELVKRRELLLERTILETGFIRRDAAEIVGATIEFLRDFETYVQEQPARRPLIRHSYSGSSAREMRVTGRPFNCVAAVVPQNASLTLGITIIASALYAGTRVLLRPALQCASSGTLLAEAVAASDPPCGSVRVLNSLAAPFLEACHASEHVDVIHYIGSNRHALTVFMDAFAAGQNCILDGQGNGLLYVDASYPPDEAVRLILSGATRYNGGTCTSVNGVLVEPAMYRPLRDALVAAFESLRVGDPRCDVEIGPLFSESQAGELRDALNGMPGARVLTGGEARGAYFKPAVVEGVGPDDAIVREGFMGPAIWIRAVEEEELWAWLRRNRFPLSDTVLTTRRDLLRAFAWKSRAARICVNADPSVESMFEPWGGYPPSGLNPVSIWIEKYRQTYQLDGRLREIMSVPAERVPTRETDILGSGAR